jgi:hypothetical protein
MSPADDELPECLRVKQQEETMVRGQGEGTRYVQQGRRRVSRRDLYVFCSNVADGKTVALGNPNAKQLLGVDVRTNKDATGKPYGAELYDAYQKPDGQITEVSYMFSRPGADKTPVPKVSLGTRANSDLGCGVGYYR